MLLLPAAAVYFLVTAAAAVAAAAAAAATASQQPASATATGTPSKGGDTSMHCLATWLQCKGCHCPWEARSTASQWNG
jgi:hypothetical protein